MGQRANLILIEDIVSPYQLFYCHWCANTLTDDVFWGFDYTLRFVKNQKLVAAENGWLDDIWAEGGLVVDVPNKTLLLWGGEDIHYSIPLRRVYLGLLRKVWAGWTVQWAHDGILEIADYIGVPRQIVSNRKGEYKGDDPLISPKILERTQTVLSVVMPDKTLRLYPLAHQSDYCLMAGEKLLVAVEATIGVPTLQLGNADYFSLSGGIHIDLNLRELSFWNRKLPYYLNAIKAHWIGWDVTWLRDQYEYQLERTRGALTLVMPDEATLVRELEVSLVRDNSNLTNPINTLVQVMEKEGKEFQVNPSALQFDPQYVPLERKRQIFDGAVKAWRGKLS